MEQGSAIRHRERGQGAVELALSIMVFMFLVMGIIDFSRAFFTQETMQQAASAGARAASVRQCRDLVAHVTDVPPTGTTSIDYAIYQSLFSLDWARTTITVSYENTTATVRRQVAVTTAYNFNVATPLVGPMITAGLGSTPTLTGKATSTVEQVLATC